MVPMTPVPGINLCQIADLDIDNRRHRARGLFKPRHRHRQRRRHRPVLLLVACIRYMRNSRGCASKRAQSLCRWSVQEIGRVQCCACIGTALADSRSGYAITCKLGVSTAWWIGGLRLWRLWAWMLAACVIMTWWYCCGLGHELGLGVGRVGDGSRSLLKRSKQNNASAMNT
ncbi:hypothetical protein EDC01DRAFT_190626 [Geopyxis carbonaria]|nr:hypothetical protein EDC01DRAFT_190626 [Geopyxis carbonaria]